MIALFVGKDYANNTIRNKICYGEKRLKIMGMTFLESAVICLAFAAVSERSRRRARLRETSKVTL